MVINYFLDRIIMEKLESNNSCNEKEKLYQVNVFFAHVSHIQQLKTSYIHREGERERDYVLPLLATSHVTPIWDKSEHL